MEPNMIDQKKMKGTEHYNRTKDGLPGQLGILLQPAYMKGMPLAS